MFLVYLLSSIALVRICCCTAYIIMLLCVLDIDMYAVTYGDATVREHLVMAVRTGRPDRLVMLEIQEIEERLESQENQENTGIWEVPA